MTDNQKSNQIFIANDSSDKDAFGDLMSHLTTLQEKHQFTFSHKIPKKADNLTKDVIIQELKKSKIVLLLISDKFLKSNFFKTLKKQLPKLKDKNVKVIAIHIRKSNWKKDDFLKKIALLPKNEKPIIRRGASTPQEDYQSVVNEVEQLLVQFSETNEKNIDSTDNDNKVQKIRVKLWFGKKWKYLLRILGTTTLGGVLWWVFQFAGNSASIYSVVSGSDDDNTTKVEYIESRPKNVSIDTILYRSLPFPNNDSILTVSILRFEDDINQDETYCIGSSLLTHFSSLHDDKDLPVVAVYSHSMMSPRYKDDALTRRKEHNADLLVYGLANNIEENCGSADMCLRYNLADVIMTDREVPDLVKKEKHNLEDAMRVTPYEIREGNIYVDDQKLEEFVVSLIKLKSKDTKLAERLLNSGLILSMIKDYENAERNFRKAMELEPKLAAIAYANIGSIYLKMGSPETALFYFDKAKKSIANLAGVYTNSGIAYRQLNRLDSAIINFNKAVELDSNNVIALHNRGVMYSLDKKYELALTDLTEAIRINPKRAASFFERGNVLKAQGEYDLAIADYSKAINMKETASCYNNRGLIYHHEKEEYDLALNDYTNALRIDPKQANALLNRANLYILIEKYGRALVDAENAISLDAENYRAHNNKGTIHSKTGYYDESIESYDKAIRINPRYIPTYKNRAHSNSHLGNKEKKNRDLGFQFYLEDNFEHAYKHFMKSRNLGYEIKDYLLNDSLVAPLREDVEFRKIIERL